MAEVMIKCPSTGKLVSTGINMDKANFESSKMSNNTLICSACGQPHTWSKKDAQLQEEPRKH